MLATALYAAIDAAPSSIKYCVTCDGPLRKAQGLKAQRDGAVPTRVRQDGETVPRDAGTEGMRTVPLTEPRLLHQGAAARPAQLGRPDQRRGRGSAQDDQRDQGGGVRPVIRAGRGGHGVVVTLFLLAELVWHERVGAEAMRSPEFV